MRRRFRCVQHVLYDLSSMNRMHVTQAHCDKQLERRQAELVWRARQSAGQLHHGEMRFQSLIVNEAWRLDVKNLRLQPS